MQIRQYSRKGHLSSSSYKVCMRLSDISGSLPELVSLIPKSTHCLSRIVASSVFLATLILSLRACQNEQSLAFSSFGRCLTKSSSSNSSKSICERYSSTSSMGHEILYSPYVFLALLTKLTNRSGVVLVSCSRGMGLRFGYSFKQVRKREMSL